MSATGEGRAPNSVPPGDAIPVRGPGDPDLDVWPFRQLGEIVFQIVDGLRTDLDRRRR